MCKIQVKKVFFWSWNKNQWTVLRQKPLIFRSTNFFVVGFPAAVYRLSLESQSWKNVNHRKCSDMGLCFFPSLWCSICFWFWPSITSSWAEMKNLKQYFNFQSNADFLTIVLIHNVYLHTILKQSAHFSSSYIGSWCPETS